MCISQIELNLIKGIYLTVWQYAEENVHLACTYIVVAVLEHGQTIILSS